MDVVYLQNILIDSEKTERQRKHTDCYNRFRIYEIFMKKVIDHE